MLTQNFTQFNKQVSGMKNLLMKSLTLLRRGTAMLVLMACVSTLSWAQSQVSGVVTDGSTNEPIPGVNVVVKGTTTGIITDFDGKYTISAPSNAVLSFSFIGYETVEETVAGRTVVNVVLKSDTELIDEIVAVGYGVQRKSDLTGAVASVKADEIKSLVTTDAGAALQGKAAGVQIINGGAPGAGAEIRVRGYSSNSGSIGPLLVVDGVQVDNIQYLDPSNIASMEVLKDAASAAIYGARAGNGVVLITTKSGANNGGVSHVTYSLKAANQSLGKKADIFNAKDYIEYQTYIGNLSQETLTQRGYKGQDTDWYSEVFDNSWSIQHNLIFEGGNQNGHFLANLGVVNNDGIVKGKKDVYKRLTAQINADYKLFEWLTVKSTTNIEKWSRTSVGNGYQSFLNSVVSIDPLTPAYVHSFAEMGIGMENRWNSDPETHGFVMTAPGYTDEKPIWYGTSKYSEDATGNPLAMRDRINATNGGLTVRGSLEATVAPIKELTITSRLGYRISQSNSHDRTSPWWLNGKTAQSMGMSISASTNASHYYQWENFLNYNKTFGAHSVGAMVGTSFTKNYSDDTSVSSSATYYKNSGADYEDEYKCSQCGYSHQKLKDNLTCILKGEGASNFNYINFLNDDGKKNLSANNAPNQSASLSYFGRISYSYDNRYGVQANLRRDAFDSSKLSKSARWGNFPSFSAGWTLSNESFFKENVNPYAVSFMKIRGSWGRNGNVSVLNNYQYSSTVSISGYYQYTPSAGSLNNGGAPDKQANPDLQWETSEQLDLGLDARFLNDRLTLGFDWYKKTTKDLLLQVRGIPEIGGQSSYVNTGEVLNQGIDMELGWKDSVGDFKYSVNANFSTLKNEVQEVSSVYPRITETGISGFNNKMQPTFEKGHKVWYFRGWDYAGVNKETGEALYYDKDGKKTTAPGEDDKKDLGAAIPTFTYGVTINLEWKGLDLTIFGTGAAGNKIYNLMVSADSPMTNGINTYWKDSWKKPGDNSKYPDMKNVATDWTFFSSSAALFDGSYFKIKQIQLGYTVPKAITSKALISDLRFSVSLDDFFTFTKYPGADPETSSLNNGASRGYDNGNYPMSKKVVLGVNLTF